MGVNNMWRLRFPKNGGGYLLTRNGVHNIEAAAFYAEAIFADPDGHTLVDEGSGELVPASDIAPGDDYQIEDYWASVKG
jgi:hypothetical protein